MIPYSRQDVSETDIEAVLDVLRSDLLTQGPVVPAFEAAVAHYCGSRHAVAVNSGTSALHLACLALEVGPGDRVWTSPITFVASANCALYCGAGVDFVDIDARTWNMSVQALADKLERAERAGTLPKVVIPVHFAGQPCEMAPIKALGERYGFRILEDASHALGGQYRGEPVGRGTCSDITVFSFHPIKAITTGEGGMAVTNDPELAGRMGRLRSHGITRDPAEMTTPSEGAWYYQQLDLGFNYRMSDLQAALGLSQLTRLDEFVASRRAIAARYDDVLQHFPVRRQVAHPDATSARHLYAVRVEPAALGAPTRRVVFDVLVGAGIGANVHYIPVYRQPYFQRLGFRPESCPAAEAYYAETVTLPLFPGLTTTEQDSIVANVRRALGAPGGAAA